MRSLVLDRASLTLQEDALSASSAGKYQNMTIASKKGRSLNILMAMPDILYPRLRLQISYPQNFVSDFLQQARKYHEYTTAGEDGGEEWEGRGQRRRLDQIACRPPNRQRASARPRAA